MVSFCHLMCTWQCVATGNNAMMSKLHCCFGERILLREAETIAGNFGMRVVTGSSLLHLEALPSYSIWSLLELSAGCFPRGFITPLAIPSALPSWNRLQLSRIWSLQWQSFRNEGNGSIDCDSYLSLMLLTFHIPFMILLINLSGQTVVSVQISAKGMGTNFMQE